MKKSALFREYARVIDMCEGTEVKPWECAKLVGLSSTTFSEQSLLEALRFEFSPTFAIAIVEGKPVFNGDKFWNNGAIHTAEAFDGTYLQCTQGGLHLMHKCSWNQPKPKTITVTIPRPVKFEYASGYAVKIIFNDGYEYAAHEAIKEAMNNA